MMLKIYNKIVEFSFYLFIFLLPWATKFIIKQGSLAGGYWEYGTISLYGLDILLIIIFLLALFYKNNSPITVFYPVFLLWGMLSIVSFLSLYWAENQIVGFYWWLRLLSVLIFLFLIYKINISYKIVAGSLVAAGLIQALMAIWQFINFKITSNKWLGLANHSAETLGDAVNEIDAGRFLRAYGSFPHPNILGGFLVICFLLCLFLYLNSKKNQSYWLYFIVLAILTSGLFFTFSRSAFLGISLAVFFIIISIHYFFPEIQNKLFKIILPIVALFFILVLIYWPLVASRLNTDNRLEEKSISERSLYQTESLQLIKKYWPMGVGIGNFTQAVYDKINNERQSYGYQPVHNLYLLIFAETGLFNFIFILLLITYNIKQLNLKKITLLTSGSILLAIIIMAGFDHYWWTNNSGLLLLALPWGLINKFTY